MNSYREALSRPIGGVGNPSPGNSCQRPQELIGCVWTDLAKLTGTLLRRCELTPAASTLLHHIFYSFNLLFIYFDALLLSNLLFLVNLVYLQNVCGVPHHYFTLVNLREQEKTNNKQVSCCHGHSDCYHSWKCDITQSSRSGPWMIWMSEMRSGHEDSGAAV